MLQKAIILGFSLFIPTIILAHGSHGSGIIAGFSHPILGVDHNIALLGCGILGYLIRPKQWFLAPFAFIIAMIVGGFFGIDQEATLFIEKTIAFSVFAIGILLFYKSKFNLSLVLILLAIFGFFHGFAHGAEMPVTNSVSKYIPGYSLGAILLGCLGAFIGKSIQIKTNIKTSIPLVSGIIIGCGLMMLLP